MSEETEYVCAECGEPALIEEEYEVFAASYGCAGTDFRYLCKEHFLECFSIHTHHSIKCHCCGKDLSNMNEFYSFWDDELYCSIECLAKKANGLELLSELEE